MIIKILYLYKVQIQEVSLRWQSVAYAERELSSDITYLTPTVRPTELGSLTFVR